MSIRPTVVETRIFKEGEKVWGEDCARVNCDVLLLFSTSSHTTLEFLLLFRFRFLSVIAASGEGASKPRLSASLVSRILGCLASDLKANLKSGKTYTIPKIGTFKYNVLRDEIAFKPSKGLTEDLGVGEVGGEDSFEYR